MAKKNKKNNHAFQHTYSVHEDKQSLGTLKDLLAPNVLDKLKNHSAQLEQEEKKRLEEERRLREEARKAEQKRLDNDFEYLLNNSSMEWKKYK